MGERFVPVPYAALQLAGQDWALGALVVHLYREAHTNRWRPIRVSVRDLMLTGASRRAVHELLSDLVAAGLAEREIVSVGGRQDGTRLRVFDPAEERDTSGDTDGTPAGTRAPATQAHPQRSRDTSGDTDGTPAGTPSTDLNHEQNHSDKNNKNTSSSAPDGSLGLVVESPVEEEPQATPAKPSTRTHSDFARILALWNDQVVPRTGAAAHPRLVVSKGLGRTLNARLHDVGGDAVELLLAWYAQGDDQRATFLRESGCGLPTLLRPAHADDYLARARRWKDGGSKRSSPYVGRRAHDPRPRETDAGLYTPEEFEAMRAEVAARLASQEASQAPIGTRDDLRTVRDPKTPHRAIPDHGTHPPVGDS